MRTVTCSSGVLEGILSFVYVILCLHIPTIRQIGCAQPVARRQSDTVLCVARRHFRNGKK